MQQDEKETRAKKATTPTIESLKQQDLPQYSYQKPEYGFGSTSSNMSDQEKKADC
jgi:hypothetical protein